MFGMDEDKNRSPGGPFGGFSDLVTAIKNIVLAANTINQTLAQYLPAGASIVNVEGTVTPAGTTGDQTINKPGGSVNFAAAASTLIVTNSFCTVDSLVLPSVLTNDGSMLAAQAIPANGSFMLIANSPPAAETRVGFLVINFI